jgi:hypothetical protein
LPIKGKLAEGNFTAEIHLVAFVNNNATVIMFYDGALSTNVGLEFCENNEVGQFYYIYLMTGFQPVFLLC